MISHDHKVIFIHINKTAGTSVERAFDVDVSFGDRKHLRALQIRGRVGHEVWDSYFKFAIVRNPWDKVVSMYHHRKQNSRKETLPQKMPFSMWVKNLPYIKTKESRTTNQLDWITDRKGNIIIDYVARFENLSKEWEKLKELGNFDLELSHVNKSIHKPYQEYYDEESRDIVTERFKKDIDYFGYTF